MMIINVIDDSGIADELTDRQNEYCRNKEGASGCTGSMGRDRGFIHKQSFSEGNQKIK